MTIPALMVGFEGINPDEAAVRKICDQIRANLIQGIILFTRNIQDAEQLRTLTSTLKKAAGTKPFWIGIDQEGGRVQRLRFTPYPSAVQMVNQHTPKEAYAIYKKMAEELVSFSINMNFGPVVDVTGPCPVIAGVERAYGPDIDSIKPYAEAFIRAHLDAGVTPCLKHFPGHGLASNDTHKQCVDITKTHQDYELDPFRIDCPALMVAHLMHQQWDANYPASLSPVTIQEKIRRDLGFRGMLISDDYHMGAIQQHYTLEEIITQAHHGGINLMIFSNNPLAAQNCPGFKPDPDLPEKIHALLHDRADH